MKAKDTTYGDFKHATRNMTISFEVLRYRPTYRYMEFHCHIAYIFCNNEVEDREKVHGVRALNSE